MRARHWILTWAFIVSPIPAEADKCSFPTVETYYSQDRHSRFTVMPADIPAQNSFLAGGAERRKLSKHKDLEAGLFPHGLLEREDKSGRWTSVWSRRLVNRLSPDSAVVSNSARYVVTFDNWCSRGSGSDTVVIYGGLGAIVRALSLSDILPGYYIEALPQSVSSIWWGGEHRVAEPNDMLLLRVIVPSVDGRIFDAEHVDLPVRLLDGQTRPPASSAWRHALTLAAKIARLRRAEDAARDRPRPELR